MPVVMKSVPVERWAPAETSRVHTDPRLVIAVAVVCAVFVCFFAIGRATDAGRVARSEAPSALPVARAGAAIPVGLGSAPPLDAGAAGSPASPPSQPSSAPAPSAAAQPLARQAFPAPVQLSQPAPSISAAPRPTSAPAPAPAPSPAPTRSLPTSESPGSGGASSGSGASTPSASGGGSFESSG
jgi:uncharacterized membrane protein YgcG